MSNEKMREEFEAWYWINYQARHSMSINEVFSRDSFDEYRLMIVSVAYDSWQSSRAALCVDLPPQTYGLMPARRVTRSLGAAGVRYK